MRDRWISDEPYVDDRPPLDDEEDEREFWEKYAEDFGEPNPYEDPVRASRTQNIRRIEFAVRSSHAE